MEDTDSNSSSTNHGGNGEEARGESQDQSRLQRGLPRGTSSNEELGNTTSIGWDETIGTEWSEDVKQSSDQLEDTMSEGLQGLTERQNRECDDPWQTSKWMEAKVPARPNEIQHEWESPRVITKGISECRVGGTTDGFTNRVDRLRLLGNGVVPQVATKAFVTLINKILSE